MNPYPKYKPSGIEWLGDVPEHWEVKRAQSIFAERNQKGFPAERMLAATQHRGVIPKEDLEFRTVTAFKNLEQFKLVCPNDFVISLRSFEGGFEHSEFRGIISPAYFVFAARSEEVAASFWKYLFKSYPFLALLRTLVVGIRDGQTIRFNDFKDNYLPLPPSKEQNIIAAFLDDKTAQIDTLIEKKRKLIELLKEERQAVINEAVTKGINPKAKMKPSGVEWLGDLPEHWRTKRLKYSTRMNASTLTEAFPPDTSIHYIEIGGVSSQGQIQEVIETRFEDAPSRARRVVRDGDTIISTVRTYLRAITYIEKPEPNTICSTGFCTFTPSGLFVPRFLSYYSRSSKFIDAIIARSDGVSYPAITPERLSNLEAVVPSLEEQESIVHFLDDKTAQIDAVCERTENEIELLQEYRTALIKEVVTGKVCVRDDHS